MKSPNRSKDEIEESIREIAKELLSLNEHPEFSKKTPLEEKLKAYSVEWRNLYTEGCSEICLYATKLYPAREKSGSKEVSRAAKHGVLLMKIAHRCFRSYNEESGDIIHFLSKTIKTEFASTEYKELVDEARGGLKPSEDMLQLSKEYISVVEGMGKNPNNLKVQEWYCSRYGVELEKLQEALKKNFESANTDEILLDAENTKESVFEMTFSSSLNNEYDASNEEKYRSLFDKIEKCWREKVQNRVKDYNSALVTVNLLSELQKIEESRILLADLLEPYSFVEKTTLSFWKEYKNIGNQKSVAKRFKPNMSEDNAESDASRTMKNFLKKLKEMP